MMFELGRERGFKSRQQGRAKLYNRVKDVMRITTSVIPYNYGLIE